MTLLEWPKERSEGLGRSILDLREKLCLCPRCAGLSESEICPICADPGRDERVLCLVAQWDSVLALEETGQYKGKYMILGGVLDPLDGVVPSMLQFPLLNERLREGAVSELILALGATMQAETTASHIKNMLAREHPRVRLTRLAQGMPLGSEVKYIDKETLKQSMAYRQEL